MRDIHCYFIVFVRAIIGYYHFVLVQNYLAYERVHYQLAHIVIVGVLLKNGVKVCFHFVHVQESMQPLLFTVYFHLQLRDFRFEFVHSCFCLLGKYSLLDRPDNIVACFYRSVFSLDQIF